MKNLFSNFNRLLLLGIAVMMVSSVWGANPTLTLNNIGSGLSSTSGSGTTTVSDYTLNYGGCKKQGDAMLLAKGTDGGTSFISNKTPMPGNIASVTLYTPSGSSSSATYGCVFGTTEYTSKSAASSYSKIAASSNNSYSCSVADAKYFCVSIGNNNNGQIVKIVIECSGYTVSYSLDGGTVGTSQPTTGYIGTAFKVSAPSKSNYTFKGWTVTSGLASSTAKYGSTSSPSTSISSSSTLCANGATGDVYFKDLGAAKGAVTLTANWEAAASDKMVYLKNTMNWAKAYVYFYSGSYWDATNGSGANGILSGANEMSYDDVTGLFSWKESSNVTSTYVSFTKDAQAGYDNFYNTEAIYCNNNFQYEKVAVVAAQSSETKNGTKYYASPNVSNLEFQEVASATGTGFYLPGGFNSWETKGNEFSLVNSVLTYTKELAASTTYEFKVYNKGKYYGWGNTSGSYHTFTATGSKDVYDGNNNLKITTSIAGTYTFTFNSSTNVLTVTYPATYTVTYAAGGGTGTMTDANSPYASGSDVTLLANTFTAPAAKQWSSWAVTDASSNPVTVTSGKFTMPSSNVTVTAQWTPILPTISAHPASANYVQGATATALSVTASVTGGTVSYQWQVSDDNSNWTNVASDGTSQTYTPSTATVGTKYYRCVVTNATAGSGSTNSNAATIVVGYKTDHFIDLLQGSDGYSGDGKAVNTLYTKESITIADKTTATTGDCQAIHYHFVGWVTADTRKSKKSQYSDSDIVTFQTSDNVPTGTTYYAVWAKEQ